MTSDLNPRERGLRRALIGVSMLAALALLVVGGVLLYRRLYLLGPSGDPVTRGPYLVRVTGTEAELRWRTAGDLPVELTALDEDGRAVAASGGRLTGLRPGERYAWTASVDGARAFTVGTGGGRIGADEFTRATPEAAVSLTEFGHLRIDVRGPSVSYAFVDATGHVRDRSGSS